MKVQLHKLYAVITGDVVGSSKLDPVSREQLYDLMQRGASSMREWLGAAMPLDLDVYSGDSWQVLLSEPAKALAAALYFRAFLRAHDDRLDTRAAVGIGTLDFVPGDRVSEGDGEAFRLSGRLLTGAPDGRRMWFVSASQGDRWRWDTAFDLIDSIITQHWTQKQATAVSGAVRSWKLSEIAKLWKPEIAESTVHGHLSAACWPAIGRVEAQFFEFWTAEAEN